MSFLTAPSLGNPAGPPREQVSNLSIFEAYLSQQTDLKQLPELPRDLMKFLWISYGLLFEGWVEMCAVVPRRHDLAEEAVPLSAVVPGDGVRAHRIPADYLLEPSAEAWFVAT